MLLRIESVLHSLPNSEKKIAEYILAHPDEVIRMTVNELAAHASASGSAVIRLCRSIDVKGFSELKVSLSSQRSKAEKSGFNDINPNETLSMIKDKIVSNSVQVIEETALYLEDALLENTIETMKDAEAIYVYGIGASWLVAEDIAHKWLRLGALVIANQDAHILATALSVSQKKAIFIAISNSGETEEVLQLVDVAKASGIKTIGLSRFGHTRLAEKVDISLQHVRAPEAQYRSAATSSLLAQFLTIDLIFYAYVSKYYDENVGNLVRSRESIKQLSSKNEL